MWCAIPSHGLCAKLSVTGRSGMRRKELTGFASYTGFLSPSASPEAERHRNAPGEASAGSCAIRCTSSRSWVGRRAGPDLARCHRPLGAKWGIDGGDSPRHNVSPRSVIPECHPGRRCHYGVSLLKSAPQTRARRSRPARKSALGDRPAFSECRLRSVNFVLGPRRGWACTRNYAVCNIEAGLGGTRAGTSP